MRLQCLIQALYDLVHYVEQLVVIIVRRFITAISILITTKFLSCHQQHKTSIQHICIISHNFFDILHVHSTRSLNCINYNSSNNLKYITSIPLNSSIVQHLL
jgi:hypothetical protein